MDPAVTGDKLTHAVTFAAVLAVAGVAGWVSYWHAVAVVTAHGEPGLTGHLYSVLVDGLIVAAGMAVLDAARHREAVPGLAWWMLAAGIGATLAVNILAGLPGGWLSAVIASWPALAFVGCYELLMTLVRAAARRALRQPAQEGEAQAGAFPSPVPGDAESAAEASMRATHAAGNPWTVNALVTKFGVSRAQATEIRDRVTGATAPEPAQAPRLLPAACGSYDDDGRGDGLCAACSRSRYAHEAASLNGATPGA